MLLHYSNTPVYTLIIPIDMLLCKCVVTHNLSLQHSHYSTLAQPGEVVILPLQKYSPHL